MVNDPESYASGSVATGRASHTTQVKSDDPHNKRYPGPHVGVRCGANNPTPLRINCYRTYRKSKPTKCCSATSAAAEDDDDQKRPSVKTVYCIQRTLH